MKFFYIKIHLYFSGNGNKNRRFFWSGSGKDRRARMGNTRGKKEYLGIDTTLGSKKKEITKLGLETGAFLPTCIILTPAEKTNRRKEVTSRCFEKGSYIVEIYVDATVMGE